MSVLVGGAYPAAYNVPAATGEIVVTLTVTAPDGTTSTPAVSGATPGLVATATVPAAMPGTYLLVWSTTGAALDAQQDQFSAVAPLMQLVSLGDLRDDLNIPAGETARDQKLRRYLEAASVLVENITGPIRQQPRVDVFDGEVTQLVLGFRWVKSLTEIFETRGVTNYTLTEQPLGFSVDAWGYTWDRTTNTITRRAYGGATAMFPPGQRVVSVSYVLGMDTIPQDIQLATTELVRHWMQFGQTPFRSPFQPEPGEEAEVTVIGYSVPNRVLELLEPWRRTTGIF